MLVGIGAAAAAFSVRDVRRADATPAQATAAPGSDAVTRLLEALPFAAFVFDREGRIQTINTAATKLFSLDPQRVAGRRAIEAVPSVSFERMIDGALEGRTLTGDVTLASGSRERLFGVSATPSERGAIAIAADRTALITVDRVRRDFIGNVSHELRTPLSSVKLMLETVLVSDDDAEARALFLPQAAREVDRMIRLVEDLLELTRSEAGVVPLRRETFDLTDVATSAVNTFAQRADNAGVELDVEAPEPIIVDADRARLTQVAVNLVDNALRHTPPGGRILVEATQADGDAAVLRVSDTGIGIPYQALPHVFERFYVVDRSRSREHGGTGLGLSIAQQIVEAHGGSIEVDSVFGEGATFTVRLPREVAAERRKPTNIKGS